MKKAIIVGGSMAGVLAGNILIREGWHVEVLERTREGLEARGAGIVPLAAGRAQTRRRDRARRHRHSHHKARGL
jgi:2-polyprenyl-6-methoxyphenol hydroxylase-like FAD-dependent oxidoreductase